jgi:probable F420-dependent oxidoreductase
MSNHGITIPMKGLRLADQAGLLSNAAKAGFTDLWSGEVNGVDAFAPLVAAAVTHPSFQLGTAIVSAYTRSPAVIAMSAASLCELTREQVSIGIGASSNVIVEQWNGIPFRNPLRRVADVAMFLRRAFAGEKVTMRADSFDVSGFRLSVDLATTPRVLIAALRPAMLRLAGTVADGAILNWLSPSDVRRVVPYVMEGRDGTADIVARLFVIPDGDVDVVRPMAKRMIATYLNVPVYAAYHRFLGRTTELEPMWTAWQAGDRAGAVAAIPDTLVDELFVHGSPDECRARIDEYRLAGVTTPVLQIITPTDAIPSAKVIASLGPSRP